MQILVAFDSSQHVKVNPGPIGRGICTTTGTATRWCHKEADCTPTLPYCEDYRYAGGQFVGQGIDIPPP